MRGNDIRFPACRQTDCLSVAGGAPSPSLHPSICQWDPIGKAEIQSGFANFKRNSNSKHLKRAAFGFCLLQNFSNSALKVFPSAVLLCLLSRFGRGGARTKTKFTMSEIPSLTPVTHKLISSLGYLISESEITQCTKF